jgi:hypothetical protein
VHGRSFRAAVEREMYRAKEMRVGWVEVGGWAVSEDHRWTLEPLRIILAAYALAELLGGCSGVATATFRHSSAMILRRIGLFAIMADGQPIPPYHDANYRCHMEALQFDSRRPNPKYSDWVAELSDLLVQAPVICRDSFSNPLQAVLGEFDIVRPERALIPAAI